MKLLKYVMPVIIKPILHLFNISIETDFIPVIVLPHAALLGM